MFCFVMPIRIQPPPSDIKRTIPDLHHYKSEQNPVTLLFTYFEKNPE